MLLTQEFVRSKKEVKAKKILVLHLVCAGI